MKRFIVTPLLIASFLSTAGAQPFVDLSQSDAREVADQLKQMSPSERREALDQYRAYLEKLDQSLAQAENHLDADKTLQGTEVTVSKAGISMLVGAAVIAVPSAHMSHSVLVIVNFFGKLGVRAGAGLGIAGLLLVGGAELSRAKRVTLDRQNVRDLRDTISGIKTRIDLIEQIAD